MYRNTFVEVNIDNLKYNVETLIKEYSNYKYYFGVVKSKCYGHGEQIVKHLIESGINYLAVASLEEAMRLRNLKVKEPILCLEPITLEYINKCIENNITITVCDYNYFNDLIHQQVDGNLKIHLKIDSGMSRLGFRNSEEVRMIVEKLRGRNDLVLEGIYTHFSTNNHIENQINKFMEITSLIDLKEIPIIHLSKSGTLINCDKISFANGVRLGIIMYGYNPNFEYRHSLVNKFIKKDFNKKSKYKSAFNLYSEIIQIKTIDKGDKVGYNGNYKAKRKMIIGIVPIGYSDGYLRTNKNSFVVINDNRYRVIGDVSMGMIAVELDSAVNVYDKVTLIGPKISAFEVAYKNNTIVYEVLCLIKESIPRILVKENKILEIIEEK